jgi:16S rRNA processing protein RimM
MVVVGRFGPPFGIKGWLNVISYTDPLTNLADYRPWFVERNGAWNEVAVEALKPHRNGFVAQIRGIADRDAAMSIAGRQIGVDDSTLPATGDDEFYWKDVIGLTVEDGRGVVLGQVTGLIETGANDVLVVRSEAGEVLIPFVDQFVTRVDLPNRRLIVDWEIGE